MEAKSCMATCGNEKKLVTIQIAGTPRNIKLDNWPQEKEKMPDLFYPQEKWCVPLAIPTHLRLRRRWVTYIRSAFWHILKSNPHTILWETITESSCLPVSISGAGNPTECPKWQRPLPIFTPFDYKWMGGNRLFNQHGEALIMSTNLSSPSPLVD